MKFYFAPMEGLTGYIYRNAHHEYFNHIDKYFTPFITANQSDKLKTREMNDILPENNKGLPVVVQLLTNQAKDFIQVSKRIKQLGYEEINLNLGCPSGTVVAKNKGAGFLAKPKELDEFFQEIFSEAVTKISVKTRIGKERPEEFYGLIEIFNQYPMEELIIHPRIQQDFYRNKPNLDIYREALKLSKNPVCYNGDLFTGKEYEKIRHMFPETDTFMIGRGLIANPGLARLITEGISLKKEVLKDFHDRIYQDYQGEMSGGRNVLFKMKEMWYYMINLFPDSDKFAKKIKKAERLSDYEEAVSILFRERDLLEDYSLKL
jgi:tRNA-dihydrouridine synthase